MRFRSKERRTSGSKSDGCGRRNCAGSRTNGNRVTGTDSDAYTGTDGNRGTDSDADPYAGADSNADTGTNAYAGTYGNTNAGADGDSYTKTYQHSYSNPYPVLYRPRNGLERPEPGKGNA